MNADSVNKWLTLSANIGVVIGLILLLIEIDQNSDLTRAQIHQARSDMNVSMLLERANSEILLPVTHKFYGAGGPHDLTAMDQFTPIEAARMNLYLYALHQDFDNLFYQYQQGYLDDEYYQYRVVPFIRQFAPWWEKSGYFDAGGRRPSFDAEIKQIISVSQ